MDLKSFDERINSLSEIEDYEAKKNNTRVEQTRCTLKKNNMLLETVQKQKFSQLNDKRYYFSCGIVSLPFFHPYLKIINHYKWNKKQRIETWFLDEKDTLKKLEKEALVKNHRLSTLQSIHDQMPQFRDLETNARCHNNIENINFSLNTSR